MRWLMLMMCAPGLLGCVSPRLVRCDAHLQPINTPAPKVSQVDALTTIQQPADAIQDN